MPGHMHADTYTEHLAAKRTSKVGISNNSPFDEERNAAAAWLSPSKDVIIDTLLDEIQSREEHPTPEQMLILRHFIDRLKFEMVEARGNAVNIACREPLLDLIHGLPGTGKSRLIAWLRELMERGLGWTHGVQFVCHAGDYNGSLSVKFHPHFFLDYSNSACT
jgi:hypothetical protein